MLLVGRAGTAGVDPFVPFDFTAFAATGGDCVRLALAGGGGGGGRFAAGAGEGEGDEAGAEPLAANVLFLLRAAMRSARVVNCGSSVSAMSLCVLYQYFQRISGDRFGSEVEKKESGGVISIWWRSSQVCETPYDVVCNRGEVGVLAAVNDRTDSAEQDGECQVKRRSWVLFLSRFEGRTTEE